VDIATERQEYNAMLQSLYEEIERLRAENEQLRQDIGRLRGALAILEAEA
jgi:prefoldin subunit 5